MNGVIPISDVVSVSVSLTPTGVPNFNINNMILISNDPFLVNPNTDLIRPYTDANTIGQDIGTNTETYQQGNEVFSQQLNILAGGGVLYIAQFQQGALSVIAVGSSGGTNYVVGDSINIVQAGGVVGTATVATVSAGGVVTGLNISNPGYGYAAAMGLTTTGGSGTGLLVNITTVLPETLLQAIARCSTYVYFNGIISTDYGSNSTWLDLAQAVQAYGNKILFLPSFNIVNPTGVFLQIKNAGLFATRCLFYTVSSLNARLMGAAYASWSLSTNYNGSDTTITMNLKQLIGILPDPGMTETLKTLCVTNGIDVYVNYGGSFPGVVSSGANKFMDEVTNIIWLSTTLQVEGFDALATVATKIPQTEAGISVLKSAYRLVMAQAVANGYLAPGTWPSSYTFGNPADFLSNIAQYGFYIYSQPLAQQLASLRAGRAAPLIQIAGLEAGAVQSSGIIATINP